MSGLVGVMSLVIGASDCLATNSWGGSIGLTSDYLVRGLTRSNDQAALQVDLHYLSDSGFLAGLFASTAQIGRTDGRDVELSEFLGYAWVAGANWRSRVLATHYGYPANGSGRNYDYDELDVDASYADWLDFAFVYSPNAVRYLPYRGLVSAASTAAEISIQRPVLRSLSATAGLGYSYVDGPDAAGYGYWSIGAVYEFAPVTFALSYVGTTPAAKSLFYNAATGGRWVGTVIWRF